MSNILIVDTSTAAVALSVGTSEADYVSRVVNQRSHHSENILVALREILDERNMEMADIDGVGVGVGPGLFTGLRVGITAAHAWTHALNIPLVYFSSLELTARSSVTDRTASCIVGRDARRSELYSATYATLEAPLQKIVVDTTSLVTTAARIQEEHLIAPQGFVDATASHEIILDSVETYSELGVLDALPVKIKPEVMIDLVAQAMREGFTADIFSPSVLYIRKSDAELSWGVHS